MPASFHKFDRNLGFIVNDVSRLLRRVDRRVRGLRPDSRAVDAAGSSGPPARRQPDRPRRKPAAGENHRQPPAARLERNGWIERIDQGTDHRSYRIRLTSKAEQMITRVIYLG